MRNSEQQLTRVSRNRRFVLNSTTKMPSIEDKNETEDEDMEQETPDSEKSEDEGDSDTGSGSDEDEHSELDEVECEKRRNECLDDMIDLERQFTTLKDQLYYERMNQVDSKMREVKAGRALEYLSPVAQLQEDMHIYTHVAGVLRDLKIQNIRNKYEAEEQASLQHFNSEKALLYDQVKQELEDKIRHLEEDRHNVDITSDLWNESQASIKRKNNKKTSSMFSPDRRRKPVTVTGPYIIYMLKDMDIIEDWTTIKKALKQAQRRKETKLFKPERHPYQARYEDGKLYYEEEWYSKGHHIIIDNREDSPVHATIMAINTGEVWVKRSDGQKSKLYIAQLQKGKYTIRHVPY